MSNLQKFNYRAAGFDLYVGEGDLVELGNNGVSFTAPVAHIYLEGADSSFKLNHTFLPILGRSEDGFYVDSTAVEVASRFEAKIYNSLCVDLTKWRGVL